MAKLNKKEKASIAAWAAQVTSGPDRGATWVGTRPAVFESKKYSKKFKRAESKAICRAYC